jgi:hypothetical protein
MGRKVFLSVGRTFTQQQEDFVSLLEEFMQSQGVIPQTVGRTYFSSQQPLKAISELMEQCAGTIVLAFERTQIERAVEKRGSKDERIFADIKLPTVWNQIEATMAYSLGHPLLVITEENIKEEGLLERGYDWYVKRVSLSRAALQDREFLGVFSDWKRRVDAYSLIRKLPGIEVSPQSGGVTVSEPSGTVDDVKREPASFKPENQGLKSDKIRILFLTANPTNTNRLRLDEESRAIDQSLRRAEFRDRFELELFQAVQVTDLQECLLRFKPHIVHFSGHGSNAGEILLQDRNGLSRPVSARALERLFLVLKDNIRCVVLNACYSQVQADAIAQHIDAVVGMSTAIGDQAAISFSAAFYQALAYGRSLRTAFELGAVQIDLEDIPENETPQIIAPNAKPEEIFLASGK